MPPLQHGYVPDDEPLTDAVLLSQWYHGKEQAFNELYLRYWGQALIYALSLTHDEKEAQEIAQNTFVKIVVKVQTKKGASIKNFRSYLFTALTKNFLELQRSKGTRRTMEIDAKVIGLSKEAEGVQAYMDKDALTYLLDQLNGGQKDTMEDQLNGYSQREIAEKRGLNKDQVRGLLHRAKSWLRANRVRLLKLVWGQ